MIGDTSLVTVNIVRVSGVTTKDIHVINRWRLPSTYITKDDNKRE